MLWGMNFICTVSKYLENRMNIQIENRSFATICDNIPQNICKVQKLTLSGFISSLESNCALSLLIKFFSFPPEFSPFSSSRATLTVE